VPRIFCGIWLVVFSGLMAAGNSRGEGVPPSETLLPKTTVGFASATNYDTLEQHWRETQIGKLLADPVMQPFEKDMQRQLRDRWSAVRERLGLSLDDLKGVPGGEVAVAMIQPKQGEAAMALLIDITGRLRQAEAMLAGAQAGLLKEGAKESRKQIGPATVLIYDMPLAQPAQAAPLAGQAPAAVAQAGARQTVYFLTQTMVGASDNLEVITGILGRLAGNHQRDSLAEVLGFQAVMKRCAQDKGPAAPQARWFIYPLGYAEAARAATPPEKRRRGKTIIEIIRKQGFTAVQGVGGFLDLAADGFQVIHRTAVYAPPPYVKSMKMFVLPNKAGQDFTPEPWVPREVSTYATLYVDILNAFDNFGFLYDEFVGQEGVWAETLRGMKDDPNGPGIDLRKELIENLGQRITVISDYKLPITTSSERLLFAIEAKDEKAVAKAIEKSVKNDPTIKKRTIGDRVIWEIVEEEQPQVPGISVDIPSLTPKKEKPGKPEPKEEEEPEEKEGHFLPHGAITVTHGRLLVASHLDFLLKVLKTIPEPDMLRSNLEFRQVWDTIGNKLNLSAQCARQFSFTDEEFRPTYELIKQGKMPESESLLGRALNTASGATKKGAPRKQQISGKNLPDYQVVRRSLGPGGLGVMSEPNGWFLKGILDKR